MASGRHSCVSGSSNAKYIIPCFWFHDVPSHAAAGAGALTGIVPVVSCYTVEPWTAAPFSAPADKLLISLPP